MALSLPQFPTPISSSTKKHPVKFIPITNSPILKTTHHRRRLTVTVHAGEERQQQTPISDSTPQQNPPPSSSDEKDQTALGEEIKKAMMEREMKKDDGFWGGVVEEIGKIEWPAFGKVIGTTGVVMGVIAGSSVVLLTVNAVLAELSDRVFVGKGVQDFFG